MYKLIVLEMNWTNLVMKYSNSEQIILNGWYKNEFPTIFYVLIPNLISRIVQKKKISKRVHHKTSFLLPQNQEYIFVGLSVSTDKTAGMET